MASDASSYDIRGILRDMRDEYRRAIEEGEEAQSIASREVVAFRLGGESFGIASRYAREVLRPTRIVKVPRLPEEIVGIFNLRGQIVAVTDLRPLLHLPGRDVPPRCQVIVVEGGGLTTALLTEGVEGIREIEEAAIEPISEGLVGFPRDITDGHVAVDEGILVLLDLEKVLSRPEFTIDRKGAA